MSDPIKPTLLDSLLTYLSPRWGKHRARDRLSVKNFYEAAKTSRLHQKRSDRGDADTVNKTAFEALRIRARHLEENYDLAKSVLDVLVNKVVGTGIRPEPQVKLPGGEDLDEETNKRIKELWSDWIKKPEVTGELDYYSAQRLVARTWFRDGEVLEQRLVGTIKGLDHQTQVPFSIELLEADYLVNLDDPEKGIVQGVQKNQWGRPRNYHLYRNHPGNIYNPSNTFTAAMKVVSADNMNHLKIANRIHQTRGITVFACVDGRLDDIKDAEESERVAMRVAAAMTGMIIKGTPDMYEAPLVGDDERLMDMAPGMIFDSLQAGESVGTIQSNRPNTKLVEFLAHQDRRIASGVGTGYSQISKDFNGTFSAQRQELAESQEAYAPLWQYFCSRSCRPIYEDFVKAAILAGLLPNNIDSIFDVDFSKPPMVVIDPAREFAGIRDELELQIESKSGVIRRRGKNPDDVRKQIKLEREKDLADGLIDRGGDPTTTDNTDDEGDRE